MLKKWLCGFVAAALLSSGAVFGEENLLNSDASIGAEAVGEITQEMPEQSINEAVQQLEELRDNCAERFIVKFKTETLPDVQSAVAEAYAVAKGVKDEQVSEILERVESPNEIADITRTENERIKKLLEEINLEQSPVFFSFSERSDIIDVQLMQDDKQVIFLNEKVDPETFERELREQLSEEVEYIQPDYQLELAANEEVSLSIKVVSPDDYEEPKADSEDGMAEQIDQSSNDRQNESLSEEGESVTGDEIVEAASIRTDQESEEVIVAIIDTGIDTTHPDLEERVTEGYNFISEDTIVYDESLGMEQAHGTHIAGIIAQTAPNVKIMPLKCFENGRAYTSDLIAAIKYAEERGASIVNCSWGSTDNNVALREAMEQSKLFFVCSAGNNRLNVDEIPVYPASFGLDNSISVTALNQDNGFSYFSNYGTSIDIATLGRDVESCFPCGARGEMNGTSMAAGFVSGAAAMTKELGEENLKERLIKTSDMLSNLQNKLKNGRVLNIDNLLENVYPTEIIECNPEEDFDVHGYQPTPEESWELFSSVPTVCVDADNNHALVLKEDGTVWTWGVTVLDPFGGEEYFLSNIPKQIYGLKNIVQIFDGYYFSFAIDRTGKVFAWGDNSYGQLGDGTRSTKTVPFLVPNLLDVKEIAAGYSHTLILKNDGTVWACGENFNGQLGLGDTYDRCLPEQISGLNNIKSVDAGYMFSVALSDSGEVYAWGEDDGHKIGSHSKVTLEPYHIPNFHSIKEISCAYSYTLAIKEDGAVWTWGMGKSNEYGKPKQELGVYGKAIATGMNHCLLVDFEDQLRAWGDNSYGQLGDDTDENAEASNATIINLSDILMIAAGDDFNLALLNDGNIYVWGRNDYGQLGLGDNENRMVPTKLSEFHAITLIDEQYNIKGNIAYQASQQQLQELGWEEGYYYGKGEFSAETGQLIIKKTSPSEAGSELIYDVTKKFTVRKNNWNNNPRVSVWTQHFKGDYEIKLRGSFNQKSSQVYYDILGSDNSGNDVVVGRYRIDPGANGDFSVYNGYLNKPGVTSYPLWKNPQITRTILTSMNFENTTFQTFVDDARVPSKTTIEGAEPNDTFSMTDWGKRTGSTYIKGIRFSAQKQAPVNSEIAKIESLQLIERSAKHDIVDDAISNLDISVLTDIPDAIADDLKPLPSTLAGANIRWTSSKPNIISDTGKLQTNPSVATNVTMTAQITNPSDQYTKYMAFVLTVPGREEVEETYQSTFVGSPSSFDAEGEKVFDQLPMWEFSYPGISNGTNGEVHTSQVLAKNGYLMFKKISDRQTDNYHECLVGIRSLSNMELHPQYISAAIGFTAKAKGTGTMRFSPLTSEGEPVCTVVLDASTKHIQVVFSEMQNGGLTKVNQRFNHIDPTVEHKYLLELKSDQTFTISVDDEILLTSQNESIRYYQPEAGDAPILSKLKIWITNITYANTEIGNLKSLSVYNTISPVPTVETKKIISVKSQQDYIVSIQGSNISDFADKIYSIAYDSNVFVITDIIGQSYKSELVAGQEFGGVRIVSYFPGIIQFQMEKDIPQGKTFSGIINFIRFQGLKTEDSVITLEVIKEM